MNTLTLLIDEKWPDIQETDWVLCGPRGEVLQQGRSAPNHWPSADRRVAVLANAQVSLCTVHLPKSRRQDRERLIAYALEERLPVETDKQHFTLIERHGGEAVVAIVDAARLMRIVEACRSIEQPLATVVGRLQCLPALAKTVMCVDEGTMRYWRWPDGSGLSEDRLDTDDQAVSWSARNIQHTTEVVYVQGPQSVADALGLPLAPEPLKNIPQWFNHSSATNLLHGAFAPRHAGGNWAAQLRWPLWIASGAVALHLCASLGSVFFSRQIESELNAKVRAIFATAFPGATVVDPVLQMRRQLNELRPKNGGLRDDDMLALLAALSDALGANGVKALTQIRFEAGALEIELSERTDPKHRELLIAALAMRGISALPAATGAKGVLTLRRAVS